MGDLEPITRNEKLWSGEDLTPVTRKEMYIKHLYDETQVIPDHPVTREEMFILKAGEELHDVTIEQLTATENKTYSEKGVAYSPVIVNVPQTTLTTLDVTENGTYTAPSGTAYSEVDVDVPLPENAYLLKEIEDVEIASFNDGSDLSMPKLEVAIEPVQDLHGYDSPWVGGSGKNLIPMTVADVKSANTSGTWSGNSYVYGGITYTIQTDSGGNVTGINANGTSTSSYSPFYLSSQMNVESGKEYIINGSPQSPSSSTWRLWVESSTAFPSGNRLSDDTVGDSRRTAMANETVSVYIQIFSGQILSNKMFYPMIRLASVTDATFAPYSNICPISGWDEANVNRAKVYQICEPSDSTEITANGVTMTYLGKGKYRVKGTFTTNEYTSLNLPIVPFTIYGGDDCYIKLNNSVGLSAVSIIFKNNTSQVDSWGLYPSNRSGSYVGMRNKYTNNITIEISRSGYGTNFDFTFKVEILSNSTANLSTYNISFGSAGTVYGGTLDLVSGVMTVDRVSVVYDGSENNWVWTDSYKQASINLPQNAKYSFTEISWKCNNLTPVANTSRPENVGNFSSLISSGGASAFSAPNCNTLEEFKTWASNNNIQFCYELATPLTIQLTPTVVKSLKGKNNVYADSGNILDLSYLAKEE